MYIQNKLLLRVDTADEVYLKNKFYKHLIERTGLLYNERMRHFEGQRVRITSTIFSTSLNTASSFTCKRVNDTSNECTRLTLHCISRSYPLIRSGKKISLKNKILYIQIPIKYE